MNGPALTPFAWGFMLISMTSVTVLVVYCYYRILFVKGEAKLTEPQTGSSPGSPRG